MTLCFMFFLIAKRMGPDLHIVNSNKIFGHFVRVTITGIRDSYTSLCTLPRLYSEGSVTVTAAADVATTDGGDARPTAGSGL